MQIRNHGPSAVTHLMVLVMLSILTACLPSRTRAPKELTASTAVVYGVVPPFFGEEPLRDVTKRLPELRDLGVDVLWLAPLQETDDPAAISYSITDYFQLRKDYGSEQDLHLLVARAHELGMKVLIDF